MPPAERSAGRRLSFVDTDREILRIAIPALGTIAIDPVLTLADTAFVARLGTVELAALGVNAAIVSFAFFAFNFLAFVTTPLVARALGRGQTDEARHYVGTALGLAVVLGVVVALVLRGMSTRLVALMGATGDVALAAVQYLDIRALASVFVFLVIAGHGAFRGHKDTRTPLLIAVGINLVNLVLDPLLIFVAGWGLAGAAWATVAAQGVGAVWFLILISRRDMARVPRSLAETLPALVTLGRKGILLIIRSAFLLTAFAFAAASATRIGVAHIAAHQLVAQAFILATMVADSLEISGQALVGEATGGRDRAVIRALTRRLLGWGMVVGVGLLVLVGLGRHLLPLIASDPAVADLAVGAAGVAAVLLPLGTLVFVADGIFIGLLSPGTMAVSTGAGSVAAVALMAATPLGSSLNGIWWAIGTFMLIRALVFLVGYGRSVEMAVRS
jgi:putative MATE family efflux protein